MFKMSIRYIEAQAGTTGVSKILLLKADGTLDSLDGSNLTGVENLPAPANLVNWSLGTKPTFGTDTITMNPNTVYFGYSGGLSSAASGIFQTADATFWDNAPDGSLVCIITENNNWVSFKQAVYDSGSNLNRLILGRSTATATATAIVTGQNKGGVFYLRVYTHPSAPDCRMLVPAYTNPSVASLDDVDGTPLSTTASSATNATMFRYNPSIQKWQLTQANPLKKIVITNANIADYISYDREYDTGVRETDLFTFRFSQNNLETWDYDNLYIIWQADTMVVNGVSTPITNAKIVLPNITSFWIGKPVTILLDSLSLTLDITLEKKAGMVDNNTFIEAANWTTTPNLDGTIKNFKLDCNTYQVWNTGIRFMAVGEDTLSPNLADEGATAKKTWIVM